MEEKGSTSSDLKIHLLDDNKSDSKEDSIVKVNNQVNTEIQVLKKTQLWKYADGHDVMLMIAGVIAAIVNGSFYSICMYILKDVFNAINDEDIINPDEVFFFCVFF